MSRTGGRPGSWASSPAVTTASPRRSRSPTSHSWPRRPAMCRPLCSTGRRWPRRPAPYCPTRSSSPRSGGFRSRSWPRCCRSGSRASALGPGSRSRRRLLFCSRPSTIGGRWARSVCWPRHSWPRSRPRRSRPVAGEGDRRPLPVRLRSRGSVRREGGPRVRALDDPAVRGGLRPDARRRARIGRSPFRGRLPRRRLRRRRRAGGRDHRAVGCRRSDRRNGVSGLPAESRRVRGAGAALRSAAHVDPPGRHDGRAGDERVGDHERLSRARFAQPRAGVCRPLASAARPGAGNRRGRRSRSRASRG